jgi:anti-sigma factor RsiW
MNVYAYIPGTRSYKKRRSSAMCKKVADHVQEIVDGELPPGRALKHLEEHIDLCPPCAKEAETLKALKAAIARVGAEPDAQCVAKLHDLAQRLCEEKNVD